jgi:hypothetical protein
MLTHTLGETNGLLTLTQLSTEWQASSKATPNTGFLDLPKEIRDMVYAEICGCLKRRGLQWGATAPRESTQPAEDAYSPRVIKCPRGRRNHDGEQEEPADPPLMFADCAIMRTCRQLHAEFATVLYATPLQVSTTLVGKYNMPVSSTYAHLVREVLHASSSLHLGKNSAAWRNHLQMATGLSKIFPQASSIRLAFYMSDSHEDPAYAAKRWPERWEQNVADVRGAVKAVKKLSNVSIVVPYNLEMVQLQRTRKGGGEDWLDHYDEVQSLFTPVTEAVAEMRAKKPKGVKSGRIL